MVMSDVGVIIPLLPLAHFQALDEGRPSLERGDVAGGLSHRSDSN